MSFRQAFNFVVRDAMAESISQNISNIIENVVPPLIVPTKLALVRSSNLNYCLNLHDFILQGDYLERLKEELRTKIYRFENRISSFRIKEALENHETNAISFEMEIEYIDDGQLHIITTLTTLSLVDGEARTEIN